MMNEMNKMSFSQISFYLGIAKNTLPDLNTLVESSETCVQHFIGEVPPNFSLLIRISAVANALLVPDAVKEHISAYAEASDQGASKSVKVLASFGFVVLTTSLVLSGFAQTYVYSTYGFLVAKKISRLHLVYQLTEVWKASECLNALRKGKKLPVNCLSVLRSSQADAHFSKVLQMARLDRYFKETSLSVCAKALGILALLPSAPVVRAGIAAASALTFIVQTVYQAHSAQALRVVAMERPHYAL